ncbi:hypothetical protein BH10CYA1_BH10CYA1_27480 [soil metagenome]
MTEEKQKRIKTTADLDFEIDKKLGIETVSFKCNKELLDKLSALAAAADMEMEPFIRRLCSEHINKGESPTESNHSKVLQWGDLKRLEPINKDFGFSTGQPVDRFYVELFLEQHSDDIRGCVLEIADNNYTKRFGGSRVVKSEILHVTKNENATLIGDLVTGKNIPSEAFDCIILTQTLPFIYDVKSAIANCHKALKHGGVLLCTVSGISQISRYDMERWGDFWRFTNLSMKQLLSECFKPSTSGSDSDSDSVAVTVTTFGNVLTATSLLLGLPSQELQLKEMNHHDDDYQVLIGARAIKY